MNKKRFSYEYSENSAMIRIIDREKEEPNGWSMCNVAYTVKRLNEQQATITALKEESEQLKQEIILYKKAFQQQV